MKRIFYKLLIPTIVGSTILPIAGCSYNGGEIETSGSIEIVSDVKDITIGESESCLSKPIQVKCISHDKQELDYKLDVELAGSDEKPEWISITDKGEIQITEQKEKGTYTFTLSAHNDSQQLKTVKTFTVIVTDDRHIVPTTLLIDVDDDQYYQFAEASTIPITVTPSKEGVEEKFLLNNINCYIEVTKGKTKDLNGEDLFTCVNDGQTHSLNISKNTDESYNSEYSIAITAVLESNPSVKTTRNITLHIDETKRYHDTTCKCYFKRSSTQKGWTLYKLDSDATAIRDLPETIQHRPITEIGVNLCSNSGVSDLTEVILPPSITWISDNAFMNQTALSIVEMPGVTWIGNNAFKNDSLMEYKVGGIYPKISVVANYGFYNCKKLKIDEWPELTWIGQNAFSNAGFSKFIIGKNCNYFSTEVFSGCTDLEEFKIYTPTPPSIGGAIFNGCDKLKTIQVPVESVDAYKANYSWKSLGKEIEGIC